MIKRIELENIRCLDKVSFHPKRINIIVGKNNTGKTTILEAISIFYGKVNPRKVCDIIKYGQENGKININDEEVLLLKDKALFLEYFNKKIMEINEQIEKSEKKLNDEVLKKKIEIPRFDIQEFLKYIGNEFIVIKRKDETEIFFDPTVILNYLNEIYENEHGNILSNYINFLIDQNYMVIHPCLYLDIERILKESPEKQIYLENIIRKYNFFENFDKITENYIFLGGNPHRIRSFGDGFKMFLKICLFSYSHDKNILLLDEPTSFMHPGYVYPFVKYLQEISKEKQIFITTHDIDLIEELLNLYKYGNFDDILFIRTLRNDKDNVILETYTPDQVIQKFEDVKLDLRGM